MRLTYCCASLVLLHCALGPAAEADLYRPWVWAVTSVYKAVRADVRLQGKQTNQTDNLRLACSSCQTLTPGICIPKHKTQLTCCSPSLTPPGDTILHSLHFKKWSHFKRYKKEKIKLGERKMKKHREIKAKIEEVPSKLFFFIVSTRAELTWTNDKMALQHRSALKCPGTELFRPALT